MIIVGTAILLLQLLSVMRWVGCPLFEQSAGPLFYNIKENL